jgi:hypothetical protein
VTSGEESEAVTKEGDEGEDEGVCDRTKRASAEVGGAAGREQGCVGAVLQATRAGWKLVVWVGIGWWY